MDDGYMDKSARFFLLIDGCEVWGVYRLIFSFDSRGEIAEISSYFNHSKEYKSPWKFIETHVLKKDMHVSKAISSHLRDRTPDCSPDIRLRYDTRQYDRHIKKRQTLVSKGLPLTLWRP